MKTEVIVKAYSKINASKITKMEDADKFKVIKMAKAMKPIATAYEDFVKDAQEKLKDEKFDEVQKKAQQWQQEGENTTLTIEERKGINEYLNAYYNKVNECVKEENAKEHELTYDRLTEEAFGKFVASNDFEVSEMVMMEEVMV